jgi:hypothetical protein
VPPSCRWAWALGAAAASARLRTAILRGATALLSDVPEGVRAMALAIEAINRC